MKRFLIALVSVLLLWTPLSYSSASASIRPNTTCPKLGQKVIQNAFTYTCSKSHSKRIWVVSRSAPPKIIPKIQDTDDQYFYGTYGCHNKIMFVRYNRTGQILRQNVVVSASGNYQLIPKFYFQGELLFETYNCDTSQYRVYTLNINSQNVEPQQVYAGSDVLIDATLDIASKTPILLILANNQYEVVTGGLVNTILWTSQSAPDFQPQRILTQTGFQFLLFGNYTHLTSAKQGLGGYLVDIKDGTSQNYFYAPNLYLSQGGTAVVQGEGWNSPFAINTSQGVYVCGEGALYPIDPTADAHCLQVTMSGPTSTSMAFSLGTGSSFDLIAGGKIYNFEDPRDFSFNEKPNLLGTRANLSNLVNNNDYVSTFELFQDLGRFSPAWNYYGDYFGQN